MPLNDLLYNNFYRTHGVLEETRLSALHVLEVTRGTETGMRGGV